MTSEIDTSETVCPNTDIMGMKPNTYCMLIHLSQLLNLLSASVPFLGVIVPIVLWLIAKDKSPLVDQHGKIVLNWLISLFIYAVACIVLSVACSIGILLISIAIGFPLFLPVSIMFFGLIVFLLGILILVFPIIGAIKANEGTAWKYPLSIPFFK